MNTLTPPKILRIGVVTLIRPGVEFASMYGHMLDHLGPSLELAESATPPLIVMDLQHVKFIGSVFLGRMVQMKKTVSSRASGRFGLCELSSFCKAAITVSKLDQVLELFDTVEDAVEAFTKRH